MWELSDPIYGDIDLRNLNVDQAYVNISSPSNERYWLYSLSDDCVRCPFSRWRQMAPRSTALVRVDTARGAWWKVFHEDLGPYAFENETAFYTIRPDIGHFGIYNFTCQEDSCEFIETKEAANIYLSLLYFILVAIGATIAIYLTNFAYIKLKNAWTRKTTTTVRNEDSDKLDNEMDKPKMTKPRLRSLDTFRGIAIVLMIFVNSGGGHYWWIEHATWNGLHVADLVFPWFLWIMGVCIPMSIKSQLSRNVPKAKIIMNIFVRSVKLFLIGLFLNTSYGGALETIRIMNVLQRFGISYFVVATLYTLLNKPFKTLPQNRIKRSLYDIILLWPQWIIMLLFVVLYLALIFGLSVPDCPSGYLGPGGRHEMLEFFNCTGGASGYIDRLILTDTHLYRWGTHVSVYNALILDPEGIFGCLLTFVQVFFGLQCGVTLMVHDCWKGRIIRWMTWATVTGIVGGALCMFSREDGVIPINKNLWSLSFVLVTVSFSFILLSFCYVLIDVMQCWSGTPLVYAGMNAILMYIGHEILLQILPFHWQIGPMNTHFVLLLENAWNPMMWMFVAYYLHCKQIYVTV